MKRIVYRIFSFGILLTSFFATAQSPQSFKYQSAARNSIGDPLLNSAIGLRINIRNLSATGTILYKETQTATTNAFGIFSISIGSGNIISGDFTSIDWGAGAKYIEIEADFSGGTNYSSMGASQLLSVPYALYAENSKAGTNGTNGLNILNGTSDPTGAVGLDGEFYINTTSSKIFGPKNLGTWPTGVSLVGPTGTAGTNGTNGTNGLNILNGTSDPSNAVGVNGEFYINTSTNKIFGPKNSGAWPAGVSLVGPMGAAGTNGTNGTNGSNGINGLNILNGNSDPSNTVGVNGEFYINTSTNKIFGPKNSGVWPAGVSLVGPSGSAANAWGLSGNTGTDESTNFIGTTDNQALIFKVNNQKAGRIDNGGGPTFIGYQSGNSNQDLYSSGFGFQSLYSNTTGRYNSGFGINTLWSNVSGSYNTAVGSVALYSNTTGDLNTAIGNGAMGNNTSGFFNTAVGATALRASTTAIENTAIGSDAMWSTTTGGQNTAVGRLSLYSNTTGDSNTGAGMLSLYSNTVGTKNSAFGDNSLGQNTSGNNNTAVGYDALRTNTTTSNLTAIGSYALFSNTTGPSNTAIGYQSLYTNTTGMENSATGYEALYSNTTGNFNTAYGWHALYSNVDAAQNTAIGHAALALTTTGFNNTSIGRLSLNANTTGSRNTAVGMQALQNNTTGTHNVAVGEGSLLSNNGIENTAIGHSSLFGNTTGNSNTASGGSALQLNTSGSNNTANGYQALYSNTTGLNNTALGYGAFFSGASYTNSTAIGYNAQVTASNMIRLGDANITSINGAVDFTVVSDKRFKKDITENVVGLPFIMKLRPVTYHIDMKVMSDFLRAPEQLRVKELEEQKEKVLQTGFIAQEVEAAAKNLGYDFSGVDKPDSKDDFYGLRYAEFTVPLVKAVQEQQQMIDSLKKEILQLKTELAVSQENEAKLKSENMTMQMSIEERLKKLESVILVQTKN